MNEWKKKRGLYWKYTTGPERVIFHIFTGVRILMTSVSRFFFESIKDSFFFYVTVNLVKYFFLIMSAMGFLPNLFVLWNWCPSSIKGNNSSDIKEENEEHRKRSRKYSVSLLTSPGPPFRQNKHLPYSILKEATSQPSCRKLHKFRKNSPFVSEVKE